MSIRRTGAFTSRRYLHSFCILCGEDIVHNPYVKRSFMRIAHLTCIKNKRRGSKNYSRMSDTVNIRIGQIKGKPIYKKV